MAKTVKEREVLIGASAIALKQASESMSNLLANFTESVESLNLLISQKQQELTNLENEFLEKDRRKTIEFENLFLEKGIQGAKEILAKSDMLAISAKEHSDLINELSKLKENYQNDIQAVQRDAATAAKNQIDTEIKVLNLMHSQKEASNVAEIKALTHQNANLQKQIDLLVLQINDERKASIARAQASSVGTINVAAGK